jgi:hypothetical protein
MSNGPFVRVVGGFDGRIHVPREAGPPLRAAATTKEK